MIRLIWAGTLVCVLGACDLRDRYGSFGNEVFVTPGVLNMRKGPSPKHAVLRRLERGQELTILTRQEKWVEVRLPDRVEGWVHGDYVGTAADVRARFEKDLKKRGSGSRNPSAPAKRHRSTSAGIGRSVDDLAASLWLDIERLESIDGMERRMAVLGEGQLVAEFWGDPQDLERASLLVKVRGEDADLDRNVGIARLFVRNAMPQLDRDNAWMRDKLLELSSKDAGEWTLKTTQRQVSFHFIKALGTVRIAVEVPVE